MVRYFMDLRDPQRDSMAGGYLYAQSIICATKRRLEPDEVVHTTPSIIAPRHRLSHLLVPAMASSATVYYRLWNEVQKMPLRPRRPRVALFFDFNHRVDDSESLSDLMRRWDAVITISETVRQRIHSESGFPLERMCVAPAAPNESLVRAGHAPPPFAAPFYLMVNPGRSHKNWQTVVDAFEINAQVDSSVYLVFAGALRREDEAIRRRLAACPFRDRVRLLGAVSNESLAGLYRNALAVVIASTHEGFGMPIVEALSFGIRCVASDIPVFREVGGNVVEYFPALDAAELARLLRAPSPHPIRSRLAAAAKFSWDASADATLSVLRSLARRPPWRS